MSSSPLWPHSELSKYSNFPAHINGGWALARGCYITAKSEVSRTCVSWHSRGLQHQGQTKSILQLFLETCCHFILNMRSRKNSGQRNQSFYLPLGDPTSPFWRRSALGFLWKEWCSSWNSSTLATSCEKLTHWKRLWCWEGLGAGGEGDDRGWDGWMASLTRWTWVWVNSGSWWWTGRPGVLQFMGSQRVGHDWSDLAAVAAYRVIATIFLNSIYMC